MLRRRVLVQSLVYLCICSTTTGQSLSGGVEYEWKVAELHRDAIVRQMEPKAVASRVEDDKGAPLLWIVAGIISMPYLANAILDFRTKLQKPGVLIDVREKKIKIEASSSIPNGYILIVDRSGSKLYDGAQLREPAELAKALTAAAGVK